MSDVVDNIVHFPSRVSRAKPARSTFPRPGGVVKNVSAETLRLLDDVWARVQGNARAEAAYRTVEEWIELGEFYRVGLAYTLKEGPECLPGFLADAAEDLQSD